MIYPMPSGGMRTNSYGGQQQRPQNEKKRKNIFLAPLTTMQ